MRTWTTTGLLFCMTAAALGAAEPGVAPGPVVGDLALPRWDWRMYGPVGQDAPVPDPAVFKTVPAELTIAGKTLKPRPLSVEDRFCRINLANVIGGTEIGKTVYVVVPFNAPADMEATFGFGADWWMQVWLDGVAILDTLQAGNVTWPPTVLDHRKTVKLTKGRHVLAVRFISGGGSSILAIGGPDDIRRGPPPYTLSLFQNVPMPPGNLITNGGFESGPAGDPFVPDGWANGPGRLAFRAGELTACTNAPIYGTRSLDIDTLSGPAAKRKLQIPFKADVDTCYEIRFKASHLAGEGFVSVSVRDSRAGRFDTGFIRAIGVNNSYDRYNQAIKKGQLGAAKAYYFFDTTDPCLVIQTHGPVHAVVDDVSIVPVARQRMWDTWSEQRTPTRLDWNALGDAVETPHTAWAKPVAGGPLKLLSLMPRKRHRLTVELGQRLDLEAIPVFFEWTRGPNSPYELTHDYWIYDDDGDPQLFVKEADTLARLQRPADCILSLDLHASAFTPTMARTVLDRVADGAGLVIAASPYIVKELHAFTNGPWAAALNPANRTAAGTDWFRSDAVAIGTWSVQQPACFRHGRGRIVLWPLYIDNGRNGLDTRMPVLIKAMLWAAGREPSHRIAAVSLPGAPAGVLGARVARERLPGPITLALTPTNAPADNQVTVNAWIDAFKGAPVQLLGTVAVTGAPPVATLDLPRLPAGKHLVHFQVRRGGRIEDWSTAQVDVTAKTEIQSLALDRASRLYTAGEPVTGRVKLGAPLLPDQRIEVELTDIDGRIWAARTLSAESAEIPFSLPTDPTVVIWHTLHAAVTGPDGRVAETETPVSITRTPDWYAGFFDFQLWCIPNDHYFATRELRRLGVSSDYHGFLCANHAMNNIRGGPTAGLHYEQANDPGVFFPYHKTEIRGDKEHAPVRYPCLNDTNYVTQMTQKIEQDIVNLVRYAPQSYSLAHEWNYRAYGSLQGPVDFCFCPACRESFQRFAREEHGTLDRLNAAWGSAFASWDEVAPIVLADAVKARQIPRWIDHRRHADAVFAQFFKAKLDALRAIDPRAEGGGVNLRVGLTTLDSFSGVDFWRLYHDVGIFSYLENPYVLAFTPPGSARSRLLSDIEAMWHPNRYAPNGDLYSLRARNAPWRVLLMGAHGFAYYEEYFFMPPYLPFQPILNADLTASETIENQAAGVRRIRAGLGHFLFGSRLAGGSIALLYSRASEHAATAWQATQTNALAAQVSPPAGMGFYTDALNALGHPFTAVADVQVAAEGLPADCRLLVLPFSQALPTGAVARIRAFVRDGGWVVADIRPGIGDLHGHAGKAGLLDDLFGVRHDTAPEAFTAVAGTCAPAERADSPHLAQAPAIPVILGPALARDGAVPQGHGRDADIPTLLLRRVGKGGTLLLNCIPRQLDETSVAWFGAVVRTAGIRPLFGIQSLDGPSVAVPAAVEAESDEAAPADAEGLVAGGSSLAKPILSGFINGRIQCFGFRHPARRGRGKERLLITPPVPGHIYDLKSCRYLGRRDRFRITLPLEDTALFASVPYRIRRPDLSVEAAGKALPEIRCAARLRPDEAAQEAHVVQFRLFAPDGSEWPDFAMTRVARQGLAEHTFVLPANAPSGRWRVEAREALSGLGDAQRIYLEGSRSGQ